MPYSAKCDGRPVGPDASPAAFAAEGMPENINVHPGSTAGGISEGGVTRAAEAALREFGDLGAGGRSSSIRGHESGVSLPKD
jgi:hypothetical protein